MKANTNSFGFSKLVAGALVILIALVVAAVISGTTLPLITGAREAIVAISVLGFFASVFSAMSKKLQPDWILPTASILGVVYLAVFVIVMGGFKLPLIAGEREAFFVLAALLFAKILISRLHNVGLRPSAPIGSAKT